MEIQFIDDSILNAFHLMWDSFPGPARLIHKNHTVLAVNHVAIDAGFQVGSKCTCVGMPDSHKGCKASIMLRTGIAQLDQPTSQKIRG